MRLAGTWKQYSKKAIDQLTRITFQSGFMAKLQVPVPGNRHENVRESEKNDCPHIEFGCPNGRFELWKRVNGRNS